MQCSLETASKSSNERIKALVGVDLIAKEVQHHKSCRREYFKEIEELLATKPENTTKQLHSESFSKFAKVIELEVIEHRSAMFVLLLLQLCKKQYVAAGGPEQDIENYSTNKICDKIKSYFQEIVSITLYDQRKGRFVRATNISDNEAKNKLLSDDNANIRDIRNAALYLRRVIQDMPKWSTPALTSAHTLKSCSPDLPEEVLLFYRTLLFGVYGSPESDVSKSLERKMKAMVADAVYNTTRGNN